MSHQADEVYHLGNAGGEDYDRWLPEDLVVDMPPEVEEDLPPCDEQGQAVNHQNYDELPIIEESPPEVEQPKKKNKAPKENANDLRARKENEEIDRLLERHEKMEARPSRKAPTPAKASKKSKAIAALSKEDVEKHMGMLLKIDKYRTNPRFAECLAQSRLPLTGLENYSIEELEDLLLRVNVVVGNRRNRGGGYLGSCIVMGASVAENAPITQRMNIKLNGFAAALAGDEEFADLCEQISIDYSILDTLSPEKRLLMCMGQIAAQTHGMNKFKETIAERASAAAIQQPSTATATAAPLFAEKQPIRHNAVPVPERDF